MWGMVVSIPSNITESACRRLTLFFKCHPYTRFNRLTLMNAFGLQSVADINLILEKLVSDGVIQPLNAGTVYRLNGDLSVNLGYDPQ